MIGRRRHRESESAFQRTDASGRCQHPREMPGDAGHRRPGPCAATLRSHRQWRKLHLGLDTDTQEIVAAELTPDDVGDVSVLPELLDQIDADVASLTADCAYDGEAAYNAGAERRPQSSFRPGRQWLRARPRQRSATDISRQLRSMDASPGSAVRATASNCSGITGAAARRRQHRRAKQSKTWRR
jgi:hypothetical protein